MASTQASNVRVYILVSQIHLFIILQWGLKDPSLIRIDQTFIGGKWKDAADNAPKIPVTSSVFRTFTQGSQPY